MMKSKCFFVPLLFAGGLVSCHDSNDLKEIENQKTQISVLQDSCKYYKRKLKGVRDSLVLYKYPADQRLSTIAKLVEAEDYEKARKEIASLKRVFPKSEEAVSADAYEVTMRKREEEKREEEKRIKALGFKVFPDKASVTYDDKTCSFSGVTFGRTFIFGSCYDVGEYSYKTADKNWIYVLMSMKMSSKYSYVKEPYVAVYKIDGDEMDWLERCDVEYASWTSYGAKIGNYSDDSHNFSKVNSVNYKLAAEIRKDDMNKPLVIAVNISGENIGRCKLEEVKDNFAIIKILNRNKL